jgi:hypothetical protein
MKHMLAALLVLVITPLTAWSGDIVATWKHNDDVTMELATRDTDHIRMNLSADNYVLASGKKVYMVTKDDDQWNVMDMDQLSGLTKGLGKTFSQTDDNTQDYQSNIRKTDRTETIAGYKGNVYVIETKDGTGKIIDSTEAVFCTHEDIEEINNAWQAIALRMVNVLGASTSEEIEKAAREAKSSGYGGVLRIGEMKLKSVEKPSLRASYYELPKDAKMVDIGPLKSDGAEADSNFAKEMGEEAQKTATDAVKDNTMDEIKKGVGSMFKKLF